MYSDSAMPGVYERMRFYKRAVPTGRESCRIAYQPVVINKINKSSYWLKIGRGSTHRVTGLGYGPNLGITFP
eukprot:7923921-Pyramimonas_sp.AAC.1